MKDTLLCLLVLLCMLGGLLLMLLASVTGQKRRVGPWLVRGKYRLIKMLGEGTK